MRIHKRMHAHMQERTHARSQSLRNKHEYIHHGVCTALTNTCKQAHGSPLSITGTFCPARRPRRALFIASYLSYDHVSRASRYTYTRDRHLVTYAPDHRDCNICHAHLINNCCWTAIYCPKWLLIISLFVGHFEKFWF